MATNATRAEQSSKNGQGEYATFNDALKKVLSVPRAAMTAALTAEKRKRKAHGRKSSRASRAKG